MQSIQLIIDMIVDMYKLSYVVNILGILIASAMGFMIFWFGVKYGVNQLMGMVDGGTGVTGIISKTSWYKKRVARKAGEKFWTMMKEENDYWSEPSDFAPEFRNEDEAFAQFDAETDYHNKHWMD